MFKECLLLLLILFSNFLCAQRLEEQFHKALDYESTNRIDSAVILLDDLVSKLIEQQAYSTPLALQARLHLAGIKAKKGIALEDNVEALHQLIEIATTQKEWAIATEAYIHLSLIHEKNDQYDDCKAYLAKVYSLIQKHQLSALYAKYAIRRASNFRRFTIYADSVLYYAQIAVDHAVQNDQETKAEAYYLLGHMIGRKSASESIDYLKQALIHYKSIGNWDSEIHMYLKIASAFSRMNQLDSANAYNDLAKLDFNKISLSNLASVYGNKARIYKRQNRLDSAWYFHTLSYEAQIEELEQENRKAITDAEEKYQTEKRNQQIEQQQLDLREERFQKKRALVLSAILLLLVALITYFYLRVRKISKINREQAERLQHLDASKSRFFANVSHELRTPLTLMLGPVNSLLKENHLSEKQIKLLTTAVHSGEQLQQLINEILDLRKLELGKLELNLKAINLYSFFLRYTAQFESLAVGKAIDYIQQIDINEKAVGQLDREKCRQILHNLLSNAFKFTPNGGRITASIILDHQRLYITVSDTGRGIHPNDIGYIFNRYFQTNRPEKPIEGGTGIGLALCKEYVELLGGKIKVESTIDQGTTFKAFFPITLVEGDEVLEAAIVEEGNGTIKNSAANTPANSVLKVKTGKPRLLIVEDNPALSDYLTLILSEKYEVTTAEHGQQALDYIFADHNGDEKPINTFQLILSDLMMPVMDGYQLLEQLKAHNATRHIPVVMLTARAELRDKLKALRIGVDDYLVKPFEEDELLVRIHNLLQHQSNRNKEAQLDKSPPKEVPAISQEDQAWLVELEQFVQKNLANSILSVPMLADQFSMSESTLFRQMKRITGLSPLQYLKEVRLEKALRILENKQYNSIAKVAYEVGYADPNSFTRAFRLRFGKSPSKLITT